MWLYDIFLFKWLYGWKLRGLIMCISRFDKCEPIVQIIMLAISLDMHSGHSLSHSLSRVTSTRCLLMSPLCSGKREFLGERMIFTKFKGSKRFYRQATSKWIQSNWKRRIELLMYRHRYIGWIGYTHDQIEAIESSAEKLPQFPWLKCQSHSHSRNQLRSNRLSLLSGA